MAVIIGLLSGSIVNMSLVTLGHSSFPIEGVNPNDMDAMAAAMPGLDFEYFIFPFLAHALGTLTGAFVAVLIAATHKMKFAMAIGVLFLIGGIVACFLIPAPIWFVAADLLLAYLPMAWMGGFLAMKVRKAP